MTEERRMDRAEVTAKIKEIIANVAGLDHNKIGDDAALRDDLNLDSLSLLEIGVDVDYAFKLGLPDDAYREVTSVPDMVELVLKHAGQASEERKATG
jgi:acyl carrier protein